MSLDIYPLDLQVFGNVDILSIITSHLPLKDILSLLQSFRGARRWSKHIYMDQVHRLLSYYVKRPTEFRDIMRQHGCIISGSSVLWLIEAFPLSWEPTDWQIFTPRGGIAPIVNYLVDQGFTIVHPRELGISGPGSHTLSSTWLVWRMTEILVHVQESTSDNAVELVTYSEDTLVMNYISADSIVSYYPRLTFQRVGLLRSNIRHGPDRPYEIFRLMYRGFDMQEYSKESSRWTPLVCSKIIRFDQDASCLTLSLNDPLPISPHHTITFNPTPNPTPNPNPNPNRALTWCFKFGGGICTACLARVRRRISTDSMDAATVVQNASDLCRKRRRA